MRNTLPSHTSAIIGMASLFLVGCQTTPTTPDGQQSQPLPTVDEAKTIVARFNRSDFKAPPRAIDDVMSALERHSQVAASSRQAQITAANAVINSAQTPFDRLLALFTRAQAAYELGRSGQELTDLREAVGILTSWDPTSPARPSPSFAKRVYRNAAWAEFFAGRHDASTELFRRAAAEKAVHTNGAPMGTWRELSGLALVVAQGGDLGAARQIATTARISREESSEYQFALSENRQTAGVIHIPDKYNPWQKVYAHSVDAALLELEGRWSDAEASHRQSLSAFDGIGQAAYTQGREAEWGAFQRRALAQNLSRQGQLLQAEDTVRAGLNQSLVKHGTRSKNTAILLLGLADVLLAQGRFAEAGRVAKRTIALLGSLDTPADSSLLGQAHQRLAASHALRRQWLQASREYQIIDRSFETNRSTYVYQFERDTTRLLSLSLSGAGQQVRRLIAQEIARQETNKGPQHYDVLELKGISALNEAILGNRTGGRSIFDTVVPALISAEGERRAAPEQRQDQQRRLEIILEAYLDLLLAEANWNDGEPSQRAIREGFRIAGYLQASGVERAIARSAARNASQDPELADLLRAEQDAALRLSARYGLLARARATSQSPAVVSQLQNEVNALSGSRETFRREIATRYPDHTALVNPGPPTIDAVRQRLESGQAFVTYYTGVSNTYVWALRGDGQTVFVRTSQGRDDLSRQISKLRRSVDADIAVLGDIGAFDTTLSYQLYRELLEPVESLMTGATRVTFVPHGPLGFLPFGMLVTKPHVLGEDSVALFDRYRQVPWLAREHAVSRVPSVSAFLAQQQVKPSAQTLRPFVGFGDPLFGRTPSTASVATRGAGATRASKGVPQALPLSIRSRPRTFRAATAGLGQLPQLPETRAELLSISASLGANQTTDVHLGAAANEQTVKQTDLGNYRIIAFATHGLAAGDLDGLTQPALALSSPDLSRTAGDGLLTMTEVLTLRTNADWVVLSACNTAASDGAASEAVSGLGRAFFQAGASALLVSNWPVHSEATAALTTAAFRARASTPNLTRAQALQAAMLRLIESETFTASSGAQFSYAHPIFWAPFTVVGDGGR